MLPILMDLPVGWPLYKTRYQFRATGVDDEKSQIYRREQDAGELRAVLHLLVLYADCAAGRWRI